MIANASTLAGAYTQPGSRTGLGVIDADLTRRIAGVPRSPSLSSRHLTWERKADPTHTLGAPRRIDAQIRRRSRAQVRPTQAPRRPVTRSTALMNTPRRRGHRCSRLLATPVMDRRACRGGWRRVQQTAIAAASEYKIEVSTTAAIHNAMTSAAPIPLLNLRDGVSTTLDSAGWHTNARGGSPELTGTWSFPGRYRRGSVGLRSRPS